MPFIDQTSDLPAPTLDALVHRRVAEAVQPISDQVDQDMTGIAEMIDGLRIGDLRAAVDSLRSRVTDIETSGADPDLAPIWERIDALTDGLDTVTARLDRLTQ